MSIRPEMAGLRKFAHPVSTMGHLILSMNDLDALVQFLREDCFDVALIII